ncbi:DMT family transporter [Fluoribacter gormanii]|uniref:DMT family transporter n=1 Tax=Fluoribacter gormanii TaxID=464 RepID=UPI00104169E6|nr:DMT family transporter [Fluoribacter gormanii]
MWFIFAAFAAILWGLNYALTEKILHGISSITLLALEMFIGTIVFASISFFSTMKEDLSLLATNIELLWLTIIGVIIALMANYFIFSSINLKNATTAGIIELMYPLFTIIFTWYLYGQNHLTLSLFMGSLFIFIGVIIITLA